jgi:transcription-repair coupling factor (superfamily II helicase)
VRHSYKAMRAEVDVLTLTTRPSRTLGMALEVCAT